MKELKYFQADFAYFCTFMNEHKIPKDQILHINSYMNNGTVQVIMFYWE